MIRSYCISDEPSSAESNNISKEKARQLIDGARRLDCQHPRANGLKTLGCSVCGVFLIDSTLSIDDAPNPKVEMIEATRIQAELIDQRRTSECSHPPALSLSHLQFLSCHRCGSMFVDGAFKTIDVITEEQDRQLGEGHLSSYVAKEPGGELMMHVTTQNLGILPAEDFDKICASIINKLASNDMLSAVEYKLAMTAINNLETADYENVRETVVKHLQNPEFSVSTNANAWIVFALGALARTWYAKPQCKACKRPLDADGYCRADGCPNKNFIPLS